jgi:CRP-like cAMP-binding protein
MHSMASHTVTRPATKTIQKNSLEATTIGAKSGHNIVVPLFSGLGPDEITRMLASGIVRTFAQGQTIARADEPAQHLYLLKTGAVNCFRVTREGRQVLLIRLSPGEVFGLGALLEEPVGSISTAVALRDTAVHIWPHWVVRRFMEKQPKLIENALRISLDYVRLYSDRHLALAFSSAEARLTRILTVLGVRLGRPTPKGLEVQITNEDLASLADIGSYTASRILQKLQRRGALEKKRGKVLIRTWERMLA